MPSILFALFLLGFITLASLGAWTKLALQWPAYFVLALGGLLTLIRLPKRFKFTPSGLCLLSAFLFAVYIGLRAWLSPVEYLARQDLLILASCLVGYTTIALHVEHPKYRRWFAIAVGILLVANFAIGIYQSQHDRTWSPLTWLGYARENGQKNAGGFYHSENHLAGFIECSAFILLAFTLFSRIKLFWRLAALIVFLLSCITMMVTYSRGGITTMVATFIVFGGLSLWLYAKFLGHQFWKYLIAFGTLFLLLSSFIAFQAFQFLDQSYNKLPEGVMAGSDLRKGFTQLAIEQWKLEPIWGTGARMYENYARQLLNKTSNDWWSAETHDPVFAHNDYAQLLGDYGAVGFALGILLLLAHLGNGLRFLAWYRNDRFVRTGDIFSNSLALALGAVAGVVAIAIHSAIDFNLHIPANALLVAALLGLLANPGFEAEARRWFRVPGLKAALTVLAALGSAWMGWLGWRTAPAEVDYEQGLAREAVGDYLGALPYYRRAAAADPSHYPNRMAFADAYVEWANEDDDLPVLSLDRRRKAIEQYRAAVALYPRNALAYVNLGEQLSLLGSEYFDEAEAAFQKAVELAPTLVVILHTYGMHLVRHGHANKAADVLEASLRRGRLGGIDPEGAAIARQIVNRVRQAQQIPPPPKPTPPPPPESEAPTSPAAGSVETPAEASPPPAAPTPTPPQEPSSERRSPSQGLLSLPDPEAAPQIEEKLKLIQKAPSSEPGGLLSSELQLIVGDINQGIGYGQSLKTGQGGIPPLSATKYNNLTFKGGPKATWLDSKIGTNSKNGAMTDFIPLKEDSLAGDAWIKKGETSCTMWADTCSELWARLTNTNPSECVLLCSTAAHGAYTIQQLSPGSQWWQNLVDHIERAQTIAATKGKTCQLQAIAFSQGESGYGDNQEIWKKECLSILDEAQRVVLRKNPQNGPVHMLLYQTAYNSKSSERAWAQLELTNENSRIHLITPIYHLPHADGIHLTNVGYARQGFHEGRAHAELLAGKRPQWIKPLSIKVQGTTALLSYHVPTPPLVLDRHTLAPTTNDGYHAYDSNGELVILAREITGNGTIVRLTFNRTPKGLLTVTYAT